MTSQISDLYEFGGCRLDVQRRVLTRNGHRVPLAPKTFELLLLMVSSPGRAFSKDELMKALWPGAFVEEANLSFQTSVLRKALGDGGRWIETVPKYGYRFTAEVTVNSSADCQSPGVAATARPYGTGFAHWRRTGVAKWLAAIVVASALALTSYGVVLRSRRAAAATTGVPITTHLGFAVQPSFSPDGTKVAFSWGMGGRASNWDIYVKSVGSGEPERLTTNPARDSAPAWSPDGGQIAFVRSTPGGTSLDVIVIPAAGGVERTVITMSVPDLRSNQIHDLDWAPDGRWIVVGGQPSTSDSPGIWLIALDGGVRRPLTNAPNDGRDHRPAFSPDGTRLAFLRTVGSGTPNPSTSVHVLSLSPDLTAAGPPTRVALEDRGLKRGLAWTPEGRGLVFGSVAGPFGRPALKRISVTGGTDKTTGQAQPLAFGQGAMEVSVTTSGRVVYSTLFQDSAIWKLPLAGLTDRAVALPLLSTPSDEGNPDYSPDGKRLTFESTRSGVMEIWIANVDGSSAVQMTTIGGAHTSNPRWSPDGQTILFNSRREGSNDLYALRVDARELRRLTDNPADEVRPRYSRDGDWIYFGSDRTGRYEAWKMPAGGGAPVQVTKQGGRNPIESPDGVWLYYAKGTADTPFANSAFSIWRVPVAGGEETLVAEGLSYPANFVVASRGIYFLAVGQSPEQTSIDFVESGTGRRTTIVTIGKRWWYGAALSPDEQTMLFSMIDSSGSNLMLVDGFR
jgi:Tol biopolymer transport system component/DNA-binding winged helix-turn-helix (wHTH) protein